MMNNTIIKLQEAGFSIEPDERPSRQGCWIVFPPESLGSSSDPEFFDADGLTDWYEQLLDCGVLPTK